MLVNPLFYPNFFDAPVYRYAVPKPKLVRKSESEDGFQFQIFKEDGDFTPFEFKLVKLGASKGVLILFSEEDDFKVEFDLDLNQIDVQNINFELNKYDDRILNLNIAKKQVHPLQTYFDCIGSQVQRSQELGKQRLAQQKELEKQRAQERALEKERKERIKEALAKQEKARKEKEERARKEREERIRKQKEEQARREKEAKKQREAEYRLWKVRQEKLRKQKEEEERLRKEQYEKAQQQFAQFFNAFGPFFSPEQCKPQQAAYQAAPQFPFPFGNGLFPFEARPQEPAKSESENNKEKKPEPVRAPTPVKVRESPKPEPIIESPESGRATPETDDAASIASEDPIEITLPTSPADNNNLHKHPSIEEVEDEEFVMLRKKFGQ